MLKNNKLILCIVFLAFTMRVVFPNRPHSLNWDEVSHGYNAYSILKTGADEWGERLPLIFRAYGDYKLPVYVYLTTITESLFGLSNLTVRLPSILAGTGTVLFSYFLASHLFTKNVGLLTAFFVAIEPWSFFLSRGAFEANLSLFFVVSGIFFFLRGLTRNAWLIIISIILFGLSIWTYNSARIFVPLFLIAIGIIYLKDIQHVFKFHKKIFVFGFIVFAFFFLPMFAQLASPAGQARYSWVAILDTGAINRINEGQNSSKYGRLLHNKATYFLREFGKNYINHFNFQYLFTKGGSHYQFSVPGFGLLYPVNGIFILISLFYLFKVRDKKSMTLISWLLLAPIASSLTRESPHVLRSIVILPVPMILTSFGLVKFWEFVNKNVVKHVRPVKFVVVGIYVLILFLFLETYLFNYYFIYPYNYSQAWQFGYSHVVQYVKSKYSDFDQFIVTKKYGEPHEFFLFYGAKLNAPWSQDPSKYRDDPNLIRYAQTDWYWVDRFDKFYFVNDWDIPIENDVWMTERDLAIPIEGKRTLLITTPNNYPRKGWEKQKRFYFLDGTPAFDILKYNP